MIERAINPAWPDGRKMLVFGRNPYELGLGTAAYALCIALYVVAGQWADAFLMALLFVELVWGRWQSGRSGFLKGYGAASMAYLDAIVVLRKEAIRTGGTPEDGLTYISRRMAAVEPPDWLNRDADEAVEPPKMSVPEAAPTAPTAPTDHQDAGREEVAYGRN